MATALSSLNSAAAVQAALDEFVQLGQTRFLAKYGFGKARDFLVRNPRTGDLCDSKAIVGAAWGFQHPTLSALGPSDFSGGEATVARKLRELGFEVVRIGDDWNQQELDLIVADYLSMLTLELSGQPYNKAAHRRGLIAVLRGRSEGSVEFKHCNISAVMIQLGFPYLRGYQPRSNFQRQLLDVVSEQVQRMQTLDEAAVSAVQMPAQVPDSIDFERVKAEAPRLEHKVMEEAGSYSSPVKRDYLEREARNRSLGKAGEEFAVSFERWRLIQLGTGQLADQVQHVSITRGDGLGYDVLSFEPDGRERFIEVKTTAFGQTTPFFVSAHEARFARQNESNFHLYRVFDFRSSPRLFELRGAIERHCRLDPSTFRASFG